MIQHGKTGFLVTERTAGALAIMLRTLMQGSPAKLSEVAAEARVLWERSFDITHYRDRMMEALARTAARML
jgi:hypothetical protein